MKVFLITERWAVDSDVFLSKASSLVAEVPSVSISRILFGPFTPTVSLNSREIKKRGTGESNHFSTSSLPDLSSLTRIWGRKDENSSSNMTNTYRDVNDAFRPHSLSAAWMLHCSILALAWADSVQPKASNLNCRHQRKIKLRLICWHLHSLRHRHVTFCLLGSGDRRLSKRTSTFYGSLQEISLHKRKRYGSIISLFSPHSSEWQPNTLQGNKRRVNSNYIFTQSKFMNCGAVQVWVISPSFCSFVQTHAA